MQDIAHNIYTSRLPPQDHCLNGPLGGPEVGREGTTCMCLLTLYVCQLLTDRQRGEPDRPSPFGRCHAQMLRTDLTSTDRAKMRPWSDSSAGPGPRGEKNKTLESWQWWEERQRRGGGRINITFICLKSVTGVWQAAYEYWEKVCRAVPVFRNVNYLWGRQCAEGILACLPRAMW